jgi:hypothetical protein
MFKGKKSMIIDVGSTTQFVLTGEQGLLKVVIDHLRKIPLKEQRGPQERLHLKSLRSSVDAEGSYQDFTFFQSFLSPVQKWVDKKLNDYHLHFSEVCFPTSWFGLVLHCMHRQLFYGKYTLCYLEANPFVSTNV